MKFHKIFYRQIFGVKNQNKRGGHPSNYQTAHIFNTINIQKQLLCRTCEWRGRAAPTSHTSVDSKTTRDSSGRRWPNLAPSPTDLARVIYRKIKRSADLILFLYLLTSSKKEEDRISRMNTVYSTNTHFSFFHSFPFL